MTSRTTGQPGEPGRDDSQNQSESGPGQEENSGLSRTLFSFLEPSLDRIGVYGTPMVLAGIIALVAGIVLLAFVPSMRLYGFINIGIGVFLIGLIALISLSAVLAAFYSRTGRYGVTSTVMLVAFTGIIIVISVISFENSRRMDLTATNKFSLAQRTLSTPVRAIRRNTLSVEGSMRLADGSSETLDGSKMISAPEKALSLMSLGMVVFAGSLIAFRV